MKVLKAIVGAMLIVIGIQMKQANVEVTQTHSNKAETAMIGAGVGGGVGLLAGILIGGIGIATGGVGFGIGAIGLTILGAGAGGTVGAALGETQTHITNLPVYGEWIPVIIIIVGILIIVDSFPKQRIADQ